MTVTYGDSFMSFIGADMGTNTAAGIYGSSNVGRFASDKKSVGLHFELLNTRVAPVEKQIRVFVDGTEVPFNDTTALSRPTGRTWSYTEGKECPNSIVCSEFYLYEKGYGGFSGQDKPVQLMFFDEDNNWINIDPTRVLHDDSHTSAGYPLYDGDCAEWGNSTSSFAEYIRFDGRQDISKIWLVNGNGPPNPLLQYQFNIGLPENYSADAEQRQWATNTGNRWVYSNNGQYHRYNEGVYWYFPSVEGTPINKASQSMDLIHRKISPLNADGTPASISGNPNPEVQAYFASAANGLTTSFDVFEWTPPTMQKGLGGKTNPKIQFSTDITASEKVVIIRETRQDRAWVKPTGGAYANPDHYMDYFDQGKYICQELAELGKVAVEIGSPVAEANENPRTSTRILYANGTSGTGISANTFSYASLDMLDISGNGVQLDAVRTKLGLGGIVSSNCHPIKVYYGDQTNGSSTVWTRMLPTISAENNSSTEFKYDSDNKSVILGSTNTKDIRIERKTDRWLWCYESANRRYHNGATPAFNSYTVDQLQKQLQFMFEEADYLPLFFDGSPLNNPIFPRGWNWFNFSGTQNTWPIPGSPWGGDGSIVIYENDVLQEEGTDYWIDFPNINWGDGGPSGNTSIGVGGGGFGSGSMDNDSTGSDIFPVGSSGASQTSSPSWPAASARTDPGFEVTMTSVRAATTGSYGSGSGSPFGGWLPAGSAWNNSAETSTNVFLVMRVTVTDVTKANTYVTSSLPASYIAGSYEEYYFAGSQSLRCGGGPTAHFAINRRRFQVDGNGDGALDAVSGGNLFGGNCGSNKWGVYGNSNPTLLTRFNSAKIKNEGAYKFSPGIQMLAGLNTLNQYSSIINVPYLGDAEALAQSAINYAASDQGTAAGGNGQFTNDQFESYLIPGGTFTDFDYTS